MQRHLCLNCNIHQQVLAAEQPEVADKSVKKCETAGSNVPETFQIIYFIFQV